MADAIFMKLCLQTQEIIFDPETICLSPSAIEQARCILPFYPATYSEIYEDAENPAAIRSQAESQIIGVQLHMLHALLDYGLSPHGENWQSGFHDQDDFFRSFPGFLLQTRDSYEFFSAVLQEAIKSEKPIHQVATVFRNWLNAHSFTKLKGRGSSRFESEGTSVGAKAVEKIWKGKKAADAQIALIKRFATMRDDQPFLNPALAVYYELPIDVKLTRKNGNQVRFLCRLDRTAIAKDPRGAYSVGITDYKLSPQNPCPAIAQQVLPYRLAAYAFLSGGERNIESALAYQKREDCKTLPWFRFEIAESDLLESFGEVGNIGFRFRNLSRCQPDIRVPCFPHRELHYLSRVHFIRH